MEIGGADLARNVWKQWKIALSQNYFYQYQHFHRFGLVGRAREILKMNLISHIFQIKPEPKCFKFEAKCARECGSGVAKAQGAKGVEAPATETVDQKKMKRVSLVLKILGKIFFR